jgi:hypothetical protein
MNMFVCLMVFNATFNNSSVISWRSVLLVEETGENPRPVARHWQTLHENNWYNIYIIDQTLNVRVYYKTFVYIPQSLRGQVVRVLLEHLIFDFVFHLIVGMHHFQKLNTDICLWCVSYECIRTLPFHDEYLAVYIVHYYDVLLRVVQIVMLLIYFIY